MGTPQSQSSQPLKPRPQLPASRVEVTDGMVGKVLSVGDGRVSGFAGQGTVAQENEGTCSGPALAVQQRLRGSDRDPVCTAHAQPVESRLLRVLEPKNRN